MIKVYEYFGLEKPVHKFNISKKITLGAKNFIVIEQIGGGGESFVFKVIEDIPESDQAKMYALKVCKTPNVFKSSTNTYRPNKKFNNEIEIAKEFSAIEFKSNFITYILDDSVTFANKSNTKSTNHSLYVMDIADESFEDYLCNRLNWNHERDILPKIKELALTVKLLHEKNYVHRDIKPQNVLVQGELFKLADFGMVEKENTSCTKTGPKYWPTPELLNMCDDDIHCSGKQTDVFMLGCMFYFIYTNKYPVGKINNSAISDEYKMKDIINKMISHDIGERYDNAGQVYEDISAIRFN